jgi:hypothetical protein
MEFSHEKYDDKKTPLPKKEDTTLPAQGHRIERQRVKKSQEKSLEQVMGRLQLDSGSGITVGKVAFTKGSKFDSATWTGIKWDFFLSQEMMRAR